MEETDRQQAAMRKRRTEHKENSPSVNDSREFFPIPEINPYAPEYTIPILIMLIMETENRGIFRFPPETEKRI